MAEFKIDSNMTVAELKENFKNKFGGVLRVKKGGRTADDNAKLSEIRTNDITKNGIIECRLNRTVGGFEREMLNEYGLKVRVATQDNWVAVLEGVTLAKVGEIKKQAVKKDMEVFIAYKRSNSLPTTVGEAKGIEIEVYFVENEYEFEDAEENTESYAVVSEISSIVVNGKELSSKTLDDIIERSEDLDDYINTDDDNVYDMAYQRTDIEGEIQTITKYENKSSLTFTIKGEKFDPKKIFFPHYEISYYDEKSNYEFDEWGKPYSIIYNNELVEGNWEDSRGLSTEVIWER